MKSVNEVIIDNQGSSLEMYLDHLCESSTDPKEIVYALTMAVEALEGRECHLEDAKHDKLTRHLLDLLGVQTQNNRGRGVKAISDERARELLKDLERGVTVKALAAREGVSWPTIQRALKRLK